MDARTRTREFLQGRAADRPPFLPHALDVAARVASATRADLLADPHLLTTALLDVVELCAFEAAVLALREEEVRGVGDGSPPAQVPALEVCAEAVSRLRALLGERAAIAIALPGPASLLGGRASEQDPGRLEEAAARLLQAADFLGPPQLDVLGVVETLPVGSGDVDALEPVLSPLWNIARFYSMPSLFLAGSADPAVGSIGASAVAAWEGATPDELAGAGANRVGVPVEASRPSRLPDLAPHQFFLTAGEIPPEAEIELVQQLTKETERAHIEVSG